MASNDKTYNNEEIKEHLKDPKYSISLTGWFLNPFCRLKVVALLNDTNSNNWINSNNCKCLNYPDWLLGDPGYLQGIAKFLSHYYKNPIDSSSLAATYGATHGYSIIMTQFFESGDFIFVEDLTYWGTTGSSKEYGLNVVSVSCDDDGINMTELERNLKKYQKQNSRRLTTDKPFWGMLYLLTCLHNPKGTSYTEERCKEVVAIARKYNILVITDDCYFPYQYQTEEDNKKIGDFLITYDRDNWENGTGHVVSNGSFSKILFPSIRLGWIDASPWVIKKIESRTDLNSGGGFNQYNQQLAANIINHPNFMPYLQSLIETYGKQMQIACDYLENNLPVDAKFRRPKGSFFIWVKLPEGCESADLLKLCEEYNVKFLLGNLYSATQDDESYKNCFRLAIANLEEKELLMSLQIICQQAKIYLEKISRQ